MASRLLPALAVAQASGIWLADRALLAVEASLVLGALAGLLACAARRPLALATASCAIALAAGALALGQRLDAAERARPAAPVERTVEGTVRATRRGVGWAQVVLEEVRAVEPGRAPPPEAVLVRVTTVPGAIGGLENALPGDRIRARLRLRAPRLRRNPGGRGERRRLARAGVGAVAELVHPALHVRLPEREGLRPLAPVHRLRARLAARLAGAGPGGGLLAALALGDRRGLAPERRAAFARLGLSHLLAVSGLHLALVAAALYAGARRLLARRAAWAARRDVRLVALLPALLGALVYALLTGWGVPVRRALVLVAVLGLAVARGRPGARGAALAAAAVAVLACEPGALFDPGAQLSFLATGALLAAARPRAAAGAGGRLRGSWTEMLRASAAAGAATAPLAALHFGGVVAPLAVLANGLAIPATAFGLLPLALLAALIAALPASGASHAALHAAAWAAAAALAAADAAAAGLPRVGPGAVPGPVWLAAAWGVAAGAVWARTTRTRVVLAVLTAVCLALGRPRPLLPPPPRVVALDVGQGAATIVQGRSAALLFDAGTRVPGGVDLGRHTVVPALAALGIRRLDLLVASHADLDHRGGIPAVLAALPVGALWLPPGGRADGAFAPVLAAARASGVPVQERGAGGPGVWFGDLRVTPLWPASAGSPAARNDHSLVARVDAGTTRILLPGDVEAAAERALLAAGADLRADVLVLPHHGSRTSSGADWLRAVDARVALASAPRFGRFGMPHRAVRERLRERGVSLWWTGRDGAVFVGCGERITVWGFAEAEP